MNRIPVFLFFFAAMSACAQQAAVGQFEDQTDIGASLRPGSAVFDEANGTYTITGGGLNMWDKSDAFHFVWKKLSGDFTLTAQVRIEGTDGNPHRKGGVVVRQNLDLDSPYIDVVLHGDGLTSMQFRSAPGAVTEEVRSSVSAPAVIRLERHGDVFEMWVAASADKPLEKVGSTTLALHDPVYAGLGVCAHDADRMETAVFSNVKIETGSSGQ
jgi:TolB protein